MNRPANNFSFRKLLPLLFLPFLILASCSKDDENDPANFNKDRSLNRKTVGASAHDLLSADNFKQVVLEIQYVQGFEPQNATVNNLKTFMEQRLNKPEGITVKLKELPASAFGKASYTINEIDAIEKQYREIYTTPQALALYFFFADNQFSEDSGNNRVLGAAYRNTSMVVFEKSIQDLSGSLGQPGRSNLETVVMEHEVGHLLGLVNVGTNMVAPHQDAQHGAHCDNNDCLMNWSVETGNVVQNMLNGLPQLDQNCLNDLRANGGK